MIREIIKLALRPIYLKFRYKFQLAKLKSNNPTLKFGDNVVVNLSDFGRYVYLASNCRVSKSEVGNYSYCGEDSRISNASIGRFTCIGPKVMIGLGLHPVKNFVSLHPAFYSTLAQVGTTFVSEQKFEETAPRTIIGNDVWIGANVVVMGGVIVGDGAVIGANAVVTKDVPPYQILGGIPAKVIKSRFSDEQIQALNEAKWWELPDDVLRKEVDKFAKIDEWLTSFNIR